MNLQYKTIGLRLVEPHDAAFIWGIRLDENYNAYLSKISGEIDDQRKWIESYKKEEALNKQFYFIIERLDGIPCGTVRVYDIWPESFRWGSWVLNKNKTKYAALESAFLVYRFGFEVLGLQKARWEVMKDNPSIKFHDRMGATRVAEDETHYHFEITKATAEAVEKNLREQLLGTVLASSPQS